MLGAIFLAAAIGAGDGLGAGPVTMYSPNRDDRPIASVSPGTVNGRLFVSRPMIGPSVGHEVPYSGSPGAGYYGALDAVDAAVPVRVGHLVVSISPWDRIDEPGLAHFEDARQFWLREHNFTGGVRTFINDRHLWAPPADGHGHAAGVETIHGLPQPRATITLPEEMPRKRRPLRVDSGQERMRISWPMNAPLRTVERSSAALPIVAAAGRRD